MADHSQLYVGAASSQGRLSTIAAHLNHHDDSMKEDPIQLWKRFLLRRNACTPLDTNISPRAVILYAYNKRLYSYLPLSQELLAAFVDYTKPENNALIIRSYEKEWQSISDHLNFLMAEHHVKKPTIDYIFQLLALEVQFYFGLVEGTVQVDGGRLVFPAGARLRQPVVFPQGLTHRLLTLINEAVVTEPDFGHFYYEQRKSANTQAAVMIKRLSAELSAVPPHTPKDGNLLDMLFNAWGGFMYNALRLACTPITWKNGEGKKALAQIEMDPAKTLKLDLQGPFGELTQRLFQRDERGAVVPKTLLYIPDLAGEIMFDLAFIRAITQIGHRVIIAVNPVEVLQTVNLMDFLYDLHLKAWSQEPGHEIITTDHPLLHRHIYDNKIKAAVIARSVSGIFHSTFDLFFASQNFFRAARMAELILCKERHVATLGSLELNRDIFFMSATSDGVPTLRLVPKNPSARLITRNYVDSKAARFIELLRQKKAQGFKIVFGSAIIGSLGESNVRTCKEISKHMQSTFKQSECYHRYLRAFPNIFYINPADGYLASDNTFHGFFEDGFDGDAMMEFWSQVQTAGVIDVWKFQGRHDIISYFESLPVEERPQQWQDLWADKNWIVSKGCCQEMLIARTVKRTVSPDMIIHSSDEETLQLNDDQLRERSYYRIGDIK